MLVMDLLGYSLEDLFNRCGRRFSLVRCGVGAELPRRRISNAWPCFFSHQPLGGIASHMLLPSQKTVLMIADQTLLRIEYIHSKSFIHR